MHCHLVRSISLPRGQSLSRLLCLFRLEHTDLFPRVAGVRMHACPHDSCVECMHAVGLFRAIVLPDPEGGFGVLTR
jgi:hypothetical protein